VTADEAVRGAPTRADHGDPTRQPHDATGLLTLLDAHPGIEFTADPLAAGLGIPVADVENGLLQPRARNRFVDLGAGRYRLRQVPRADIEDGADRVVDPAQQQAQHRMLTWYLRRTAAAGKILDPFAPRVSPVFGALDRDTAMFDDTAAAVSWIEAEHANVVAAQHIARTRGWHELVYEFAEALWTPLWITCRTAELAEIQRIGADAAAHCGHRLEPVCRARQASGESACGRHHDALATCTVAVERALALDDHWALAIAFATRARINRKAGDIRAAQRDQCRALAINTTRCAPRGQAQDHRRLGEIALDPAVDDPHLALTHLVRAAQLFRATGDAVGHARTVISMARARLRLRRSGTALTELAGIEDVLSDYGAPGHLGDLAAVRAEAHTRLGNHTEAYRCYCVAAEHYAVAGPGAADALCLAIGSRDALRHRSRPGRAS